MPSVQGVIDGSIGRLLRWGGGQWARGASRVDYGRDTLSTLATAIGDVLSTGNAMGRGSGQDARYRQEVIAADGRVAAAAAAINDDELHERVKAFRGLTDVYRAGDFNKYDRPAFDAGAVAVLDRIRELNAQLDK